MNAAIHRANGAAMLALKPTDLDCLTDEQLQAAILNHMGKAPAATSAQLAEWVQDGEGLDGWWGRYRRRHVVRAAVAVAPVVVAAAPAPVNWATLHGLDELAGGKWKKRLKRLKKNITKVAKVAVAPQWGGTKGIKKQFDFAKKHKGLLVGAAGLLTGNPALIAAGKQMQSQSAAKAQDQAQADYDATAASVGMQTDTAQAPQYAQPATRGGYASFSQPEEGQVTRLAQDDSEPSRVVGFNWGGLMDNIKENPLPWAAGGFGLLYLITRKN